MTDDINYEEDWAGECRIDPDGNAFVLRKVGHNIRYGYCVVINDILGGHTTTISIDEWLEWEVAP